MSRIRITWKKSTIGRPPRQERTIKALGLHRLNETIYREDTPQVRGMVESITHLLEWTVEE